MKEIKQNIKPCHIIISGTFIILLGFIGDASNVFAPWIKIATGIALIIYGIINKIKNKHE
jgi:hypothetical protein